jgi:hypothetical protein
VFLHLFNQVLFNGGGMSLEKRDDQIIELLGQEDNSKKKDTNVNENKPPENLQISLSCIMKDPNKGQILFELSVPGKPKYTSQVTNLREISIFSRLHDLVLRDEVFAIIKAKLEGNQDDNTFFIPSKFMEDELSPSVVNEFLAQVGSELNFL